MNSWPIRSVLVIDRAIARQLWSAVADPLADGSAVALAAGVALAAVATLEVGLAGRVLLAPVLDAAEAEVVGTDGADVVGLVFPLSTLPHPAKASTPTSAISL